ncbi:MAG: methyltransferase domain-containing protein [candidate division NC10 bacterium]|nr:methyltransferase domain-containing protein [candidate division NC10 bacterium]
MDLPGADQDELARTLEDLAWIHRWLGGIRLVRTELPPIFHGLRGPIRILDVATGYADIPRAIVRWGRQRHLAIKFEGLDHHDQILALARQASATSPEIRLRQANALDLPYPDGHFDVVLASLVLHHMEGEEQVRLLRELYRVARRAVLVNDLRRGRWAFLITWASLHVVPGGSPCRAGERPPAGSLAVPAHLGQPARRFSQPPYPSRRSAVRAAGLFA